MYLIIKNKKWVCWAELLLANPAENVDILHISTPKLPR